MGLKINWIFWILNLRKRKLKNINFMVNLTDIFLADFLRNLKKIKKNFKKNSKFQKFPKLKKENIRTVMTGIGWV